MRGSASSLSRDQQAPPLSAITYTPPWNIDGTRQSSSGRRRSQISVENCDFCHSGFLSEYIAITFDTEKLQWRSYPVVKNFEDNYVYSFQENTRTWQTDGRTPHNGSLGRALHSIARQKYATLVLFITLANVDRF